MIASEIISQNGMFAVAFLIIASTITLVFYPRKTLDEELQQKSTQEVDRLAIPRIVMFSFICVFFLLGFLMLILDFMNPVYSPAVTAKRTYTF